MKNIIFILAILTFSCKEDEPPVPEPKKGRLEVEYNTADPQGMNLYCQLDNANSVGILDINSNYYKIDTVVASGIAYTVNAEPKNGGYTTILVKFEGDTVCFTGTHLCSGTLPKIK